MTLTSAIMPMNIEIHVRPMNQKNDIRPTIMKNELARISISLTHQAVWADPT
jgi:hypothetical protein